MLACRVKEFQPTTRRQQKQTLILFSHLISSCQINEIILHDTKPVCSVFLSDSSSFALCCPTLLLLLCLMDITCCGFIHYSQTAIDIHERTNNVLARHVMAWMHGIHLLAGFLGNAMQCHNVRDSPLNECTYVATRRPQYPGKFTDFLEFHIIIIGCSNASRLWAILYCLWFSLSFSSCQIKSSDFNPNFQELQLQLLPYSNCFLTLTRYDGLNWAEMQVGIMKKFENLFCSQWWRKLLKANYEHGSARRGYKVTNYLAALLCSASTSAFALIWSKCTSKWEKLNTYNSDARYNLILKWSMAL